MKIKQSKYWGNVAIATMTLYKGLRRTAHHIAKASHQREPIGVSQSNYFELQEGLATLQYPNESLPVPDNGRYRLHNEIDDCIVCDKCAKVCPVDCIDIEPIRAVEELGKTSDGTPKRIHAAKFDIDMGKCCFCGLCTTVCPTECLTMTKVYEFSEFDVKDHNYVFATMTPMEIVQKREALEAYNLQKQKATATQHDKVEDISEVRPQTIKPVFRPKIKPVVKNGDESVQENKPTQRPKPVFKPKVKPVVKKKDPDPDPDNYRDYRETEEKNETEKTKKVRPKIKMKPVIKKPEEDKHTPEAKKTGRPRPIIKPKKDKEE